MADTMHFTYLEGAHAAALGMHVNEYGNSVVVYDMDVIETMFDSKIDMIDWIEKRVDTLPEEIRPIFIRLMPFLGEKIRATAGTQH